MPRKIHHDHRKHRYVRTNSHAQTCWMHYTYKTGYHGVPYAPSWRGYRSFAGAPNLIHKGKKP